MSTQQNQLGATVARGARAFTLVELLTASLISVFVAGATTMALSQLIRARDGAAARLDAFERAESAASLIAHDAMSAVRDADPFFVRVLIEDDRTNGSLVARGAAGATAGLPADRILLFVRSLRRVRPLNNGPAGPSGVPEGDEYEVQFRLQAATGAIERVHQAGLLNLWRRSDAVPDEAADGGGVASPVAAGLISLSIQAYDGVEWRDEWDSDYDGMPHAIRVQIIAADDSGRRSATARRTVSLDRTPLPVTVDEESETGSSESDEAGGQQSP